MESARLRCCWPFDFCLSADFFCIYVLNNMPSSLQGQLAKAGIVAAVGGLLSVLVLSGMDGVAVTGGMVAPKFVVHAAVLGASSLATSYAVPALVPWVSAGSPQLQKFESLVLEPLVLGAISFGVESVVAPNAEVGGPGGTLKTLLVGSAAAVGAAYVTEGMGWTS